MSLRGEPLFEGLNFKELFGRELVVDKEFLSYDGIPLLCVCKDEDEKLYFCNCTEVRSEERWVLYPATKRQIEQIVSKSKTPAEVFQDSRVVYSVSTPTRIERIRAMDKFHFGVLLNDIRHEPQKYPECHMAWIDWLNGQPKGTIIGKNF